MENVGDVLHNVTRMLSRQYSLLIQGVGRCHLKDVICTDPICVGHIEICKTIGSDSDAAVRMMPGTDNIVCLMLLGTGGLIRRYSKIRRPRTFDYRPHVPETSSDDWRTSVNFARAYVF
jgi:hypothetical protein